MRAQALHVITLAACIAGVLSSANAQESRRGRGGYPNTFEITDASAGAGNIAEQHPMDAIEQALESYPDPVVDQPSSMGTQAPSFEPPGHESGWNGLAENERSGAYDRHTSHRAEMEPIAMQDCGGQCRRERTCGAGAFMDLWIAGGYTYNDADPPGGFNGPLTFNDFSNEGQMNQLYLSFGRAVDKCNRCWDIGGRVDVLYGTDYFFTTADGLETEEDGRPHWNSDDGSRRRGGYTYADYGVAMPQAYGELFIPLGTGLSVKIGHFYTPLGYESVQAPENFFYSHSYTFQYGNPFTHTGVMFDWAIGSKFNAYFAYTEGWNNWEDINGKPNFLTGFTWCPSRVASLAFGVSTGNEDLAGQNNRSLYNIVYTRRFGQLTYVLEHSFGMEANAEVDENFETDSAKWYGLVQYFYMDISPTLTAGMRVDWFRDQDRTRVLQLPFETGASGGNYVGLTMGANWKPTCNLLLRPEIRYDYSDVEAL